MARIGSKIKISIMASDHRTSYSATAYATKNKDLAVHEEIGLEDANWVVTHIPTGLCLGNNTKIFDKSTALKIAAVIGEGYDWSFSNPAERPKMTEGWKAKVREKHEELNIPIPNWLNKED